MNFRFVYAVLGLACIAGLYTPGTRAADELRFGSVAMHIPAEMHRRLTPLTSYLSEAMGQPVSLKLSPNMPAAIEEVSTGSVELAYLTPVAYLRAHSKGGSRLVVKTVTNDAPSFQLMIVVPEQSDIKTVEDLAGRRFAFGDKAALLQRAVVVGAGMPLERLGEYAFIGHYDNIARGVMNGDFDAGILKDTSVVKWQKNGLRVLHASPHLPPYNIAASKNVDDATLSQLRKAFLALSIDNPRHAEIIRALDSRYTGFAPTDDAEYEVVRQLVKPFE